MSETLRKMALATSVFGVAFVPQARGARVQHTVRAEAPKAQMFKSTYAKMASRSVVVRAGDATSTGTKAIIRSRGRFCIACVQPDRLPWVGELQEC